jgi:hypothetical protein
VERCSSGQQFGFAAEFSLRLALYVRIQIAGFLLATNSCAFCLGSIISQSHCNASLGEGCWILAGAAAGGARARHVMFIRALM